MLQSLLELSFLLHRQYVQQKYSVFLIELAERREFSSTFLKVCFPGRFIFDLSLGVLLDFEKPKAPLQSVVLLAIKKMIGYFFLRL